MELQKKLFFVHVRYCRKQKKYFSNALRQLKYLLAVTVFSIEREEVTGALGGFYQNEAVNPPN
jgi:hypothetical protein